MNRNYRQKILDKFGSILTNPGAILLSNDENDFWSLIDEVSFTAKRLIEIGTARGISATLLAEVSDEILTFDIKDYPIKHKIWKYFEVEDKITDFIVKDTSDIAKELVQFDAAFLDGNHAFPYIIRDIFLVEKCGRILFHDIDIPSVANAVDELIARQGGKVVVKNKFAFWTNLNE